MISLGKLKEIEDSKREEKVKDTIISDYSKWLNYFEEDILSDSALTLQKNKYESKTFLR